MIFPEDYELEEDFEAEEEDMEELPELMDYDLDMSVEPWEIKTDGGAPGVAKGIEALRIWIKKALLTAYGRYAYDGFGAMLLSVETSTDAEVMTKEAEDAIRGALEESDYIISVDDFKGEREGNILQLSFCVHTIYGDFYDEAEVDYGSI